MIPAEIAEQVNNPGQAISFGSSNTQLQPQVGRAFGVKAEEGGILSIVLPKNMFQPHENNLKQNKHFSITVTYPPTHKSFQFKGECTGWADGAGPSAEHAKTNLEVFHQILIQFYGPDAANHFLKYDSKDLVQVKMNIREIFDQTPGPGAGRKIYPN